jgi:lysophospholipase L1-like esterase
MRRLYASTFLGSCVLASAAAGGGIAPIGSGQQTAEKTKAAGPKKDVDWGAIFRIHYHNRVNSFREQNLLFRNVILLGDSITEGFELTKYFPGRRVLNRGIGADVIGTAQPSADDPRGVIWRLDCSVFDCAATDVFLMIGINDLNSGRVVDTMETDYRELLRRIKSHAPAVRVHVQSLLPTRGGHAKQNAPVREFNQRLKRLAAEFSYDFLDLHRLFTDASGELKPEFTADGLHLTEPGYQVWRSEVEKAMGWSTPAK